MWPFSSKELPEDTTERLDRLEKAMRRLEEEWSDVYHKFRVLQMRVAKQVQRLDQASPETAETTQRAGGEELPPGAALSDRQQRLQQEILARRRKGGNSGLLHG